MKIKDLNLEQVQSGIKQIEDTWGKPKQGYDWSFETPKAVTYVYNDLRNKERTLKEKTEYDKVLTELFPDSRYNPEVKLAYWYYCDSKGIKNHADYPIVEMEQSILNWYKQNMGVTK